MNSDLNLKEKLKTANDCRSAIVDRYCNVKLSKHNVTPSHFYLSCSEFNTEPCSCVVWQYITTVYLLKLSEKEPAVEQTLKKFKGVQEILVNMV